MKQITFLSILVIFISTGYSQSNEFIGVLGGGGPHGTGVIYKTDSVGNFKKLVHTFEKVAGRRPVGELALGADGSFYGIASSGGNYGKGVLFQYFPTNQKYKALFHFGANSFAGSNPMAGIILASNGKLYGSTQQGGTKGQGSLFCYNITQDSLTFFHSFENVNNSGYAPQAPFTETKDGHLVIVTFSGGTFGSGAIYKIDTSIQTASKVADFSNLQTGRNPAGALVEVSPNIFYGITQLGGSKDKGVLFKFNLNTKTLTNKKNFADKLSGEYPYGGLMLASNGKLYGTTSAFPNYSDVLYEYNQVDSTFKRLYEFTSAKGDHPRSVLVEGQNGILYGTTCFGGNSNEDGTIYAYKIGTDTITKLWTFEETKYGNRPYSGVTFGKDGKLYGLVREGKGAAYDGTLYSFDLAKSTFDRPIFFNSSKNGIQPSGNLVQASNALVYGITQIGGENNHGMVFSINPTTNVVKVETNFTDSTGLAMSQGFIEASNGKLFGICNYGVNGAGNIIEFDPNTKTLKNVADFEATVKLSKNSYSILDKMWSTLVV